MADFMKILQQAQQVQGRLQQMQEQLEKLTVTATAGGGMVTVEADGKGHVRRIKLDPAANFAYSYGTGNRIQVFDIGARAAVAVLDFPGASNLDIQDIAFNVEGSEMYVVGTLSVGTDVDSVFATAKITSPAVAGAAPTYSWSAASVVCDIRFVRRLHRPGIVY